MPPRHTYWTIIFGGHPTSFRSATREELLPTFKQIQSRHPDAVMKFFARGRLWASDEEARAELFRHRATRPRRPEGRAQRPADHGPRTTNQGPRTRDHGPRTTDRGPAWRPGGQHQDPRARFKIPRDVKRRHLATKFGWKKKKEDQDK